MMTKSSSEKAVETLSDQIESDLFTLTSLMRKVVSRFTFVLSTVIASLQAVVCSFVVHGRDGQEWRDVRITMRGGRHHSRASREAFFEEMERLLAGYVSQYGHTRKWHLRDENLTRCVLRHKTVWN